MKINNSLIGLLNITVHLLSIWTIFFLLSYFFKIYFLRDFLIQLLATGLGVLGGMWTNKKLQEESLNLEIGYELELINVELQSNIHNIPKLQNLITSRPSLSNRQHLQEVFNNIKGEEEFLAKAALSSLDTDMYKSVMPIVAKLRNRVLIENILNAYYKLRTVRSMLALPIHNELEDSLSAEELNQRIKIADDQFNLLHLNLGKLKQELENLKAEINKETRKLLEV